MAETYSFEDRTYLEPTVSRDEQLGFIDRLREIENNDLQKIATDTHNLGTDVPSNLGGLSGIGKPNSLGISGADTGSAGIWRNRYERPQVNALVADLKATAQASALDTAMNNLLNQYKNRYNQAVRRYNKSGGGGVVSDDPYDVNAGDPYSEALKTGNVGEENSTGSYKLKDSGGGDKGTINIITDAKGNIIGVDTPGQSFGGADEGYSGANYIQNLINGGYTFWDANDNQVTIDPGL